MVKTQFPYGLLNLLGVIRIDHIEICSTPEILYRVVGVIGVLAFGWVGVDFLGADIVSHQQVKRPINAFFVLVCA